MRLVIATLALWLLAIPVFSQSDTLKQLQSELSQKEGPEYISIALELAEGLYSEGLYSAAHDAAGDAFDAAKKLKHSEAMAIALNQRAKALMMMDGKRNANRALKAFEDSNELTKSQLLRIKNLVKMKTLAMRLNKKKALLNIEKELASLQVSSSPAIATTLVPKGGIFNQKKRDIQLQLSEVQGEKDSLKMEVTELTQTQAELQNIVLRNEAAIMDMNEQQIKQQLILVEQSRLLDSLTYTSILDSMELSQKEMLVKQQEYELWEKESEIQLRNSQRNLMIALAILGILVALGLTHRYVVLRKLNAELAQKNEIIAQEKKRSEELLLNILPVTVADELKLSGSAQTRHYDEATVLFTDFQGFSAISKKLSPKELVETLDYAFKTFDLIITKYGLEKIKTIGDAYMCAGGLPGLDGTHPVNVVQAALEIQQFLRNWNAERVAQGKPAFRARIGIHTGPLVAGVVGSKKFAYDIWGDTVNVASRMESNSEPGKVNISQATFQLIKENFNCEYRGKVPAKNVGEVEMYFVEEPELLKFNTPILAASTDLPKPDIG